VTVQNSGVSQLGCEAASRERDCLTFDPSS
jgi:hypothetical protein